MCGRSACALAPSEFRQRAYSKPVQEWRGEDMYRPSFNKAPGSMLPVLTTVGHQQPSAASSSSTTPSSEKIFMTCKWGLVPSWSKTKTNHFKMSNARSETALEKSSFQRLFAKNRCVVFMQGFYEWREEKNGTKQPYFVHFSVSKGAVKEEKGEEKLKIEKDEGGVGGGGSSSGGSLPFPLMPMAALRDHWTSPDGTEEIDSFTILTTAASPRLQWLHNRMPVILCNEEEVDLWLNSEASEADILALMRPCNEDFIEWYPVSTFVNKIGNNAEECVVPISEEEKEILQTAKASKGKRGAKAGAAASTQKTKLTSFFKPAGASGVKREAAEEPCGKEKEEASKDGAPDHKRGKKG